MGQAKNRILACLTILMLGLSCNTGISSAGASDTPCASDAACMAENSYCNKPPACRKGKCMCQIGYTEVDAQCIESRATLVVGYNKTCYGSIATCNVSQKLQCNKSTSKCECMTGRSYDTTNMFCLTDGGIYVGDNCSKNGDCENNNETTECDTGNTKKCKCKTAYMQDGLFCRSPMLQEACDSKKTCIGALNLQCNDSSGSMKCICVNGYIENNPTKSCRLQETQGPVDMEYCKKMCLTLLFGTSAKRTETCKNGTGCYDSTMMTCTNGTCQCATGYLASETTCRAPKRGETCQADTVCSANMNCINGTCQCNSGYKVDGDTCRKPVYSEACTVLCSDTLIIPEDTTLKKITCQSFKCGCNSTQYTITAWTGQVGCKDKSDQAKKNVHELCALSSDCSDTLICYMCAGDSNKTCIPAAAQSSGIQDMASGSILLVTMFIVASLAVSRI